jgi:hypothetical protein
MSYIGAQPTTAAFPFDQFSGNGSTTAFTMSYAPGGTTSIIVSISGVVQNPNTYTVSGVTLTFSPAPPTGTNNIGVLYLGLPAITGGGGGASTPAAVSDQANTSTGYFDIPSGTTAQRPSSCTTGGIRYNSTLGYPEWFDGTTWWAFSEAAAYNVEYLVVGGGGGGGQQGGGGGAGGFRTASGFSISLGTSYTVTVGAGGAANAVGVASVFSTISSAGGGNGGRAAGGSINGANGGSGGGAAVTSSTGSGGSGNTPSVAPAQGTNGGNNATTSGFGGGGGGGASAPGANGTTTAGGAGGAGTLSSITGTATTYAGGGGAGLFVAGTPGAGGAGGGGAGAVTTGNATSGTANTGGGGGGNGASTGTVGAGGSGVVILKYLAAFTLTAGAGLTVSTVTSGAYKVSTFTLGSDTISFS